MNAEVWKAFFENNQGIAIGLVTTLIFPLAFLYLNNRNSRKLKTLEKELELKYLAKNDIRDQEKIVFSSLTKVLFDVQQLHVNLSGSCIDENCIPDAIKRFDENVNRCHAEISNNMLYLSSNAINSIYAFYNQISDLKINLKVLHEQKQFDLAHVAVYYGSQDLAGTVINIQELFVKEKKDLQIAFNKTAQENMRYCCGQEPPEEQKKRFEALKGALHNRGVDAEANYPLPPLIPGLKSKEKEPTTC